MQLALLCDLWEIPPELVYNSDQTGVRLIPSSDYTRAAKGSIDVSVHGYGDKRQITVVPTTTATGHSLPMQVIYQGKTSASLPPKGKIGGQKFAGWHWTQTENHWSNLHTSKQLVREIIAPYVQRTCESKCYSRERLGAKAFSY